MNENKVVVPAEVVFTDQSEFDTITHLHNEKEATEILSATFPDLIDVVAYRDGPNKHLQLSVRQLNSFMRENYSGFIQNVGKNIYPLILASDYEPGFEGVGSTFTLFLRDGSQHKIAPTVNTNYEIYKGISHCALAIFILLSPHLKNPTNIQWKSKLIQLKDNLLVVKDALQNSDKEETFKYPLLELLSLYLNFIDTTLSDGTFTLDSFLGFTAHAFEKIRVNMAEATRIQAEAILPAMLKWKRMLGPSEWSKVYIMIPTVWPVALNSPRLQLFERIIDSDKIKTHIITSEYPRNIEEARDVIGRVVGDRSVGRLVFGTNDTKAKMKVLALSSRTDVVADDFEIALDRVISQLSPEDQELITCKTMPTNSTTLKMGMCPINHNESSLAPKILGVFQLSRIMNVQLIGMKGYYDVILTSDGLINDITTHSPAIAKVDSSILDGRGKMLLPGLVDAHVHLDKCYLLDRCCASTGDFPEAMSETLNAKKAFTFNDIQTRARRLIENEISWGTTLLRTHIEVDPIIGTTAYNAIRPLLSEYSNAITIQVCLFAQEGITNQVGQLELMTNILENDINTHNIIAIGSAPYCDIDPEMNIQTIFELAVKFNKSVDFHLDYHLDSDKPSLLAYVCQQTRKYGWQNRVVCGHMTYLSTLSMDKLIPICAELKELGISLIALPASDICMMARQDKYNTRRGICPVRDIGQLGVNTCFATNNIQNLFTFTGDGDVLKIGTLLCQLLHLTNEDATEQCIHMATTYAAKALGVTHGIVMGNSADFVLLDGFSAMSILASPPLERIVIKRGKIVSETSYKKTLFL